MQTRYNEKATKAPDDFTSDKSEKCRINNDDDGSFPSSSEWPAASFNYRVLSLCKLVSKLSCLRRTSLWAHFFLNNLNNDDDSWWGKLPAWNYTVLSLSKRTRMKAAEGKKVCRIFQIWRWSKLSKFFLSQIPKVMKQVENSCKVERTRLNLRSVIFVHEKHLYHHPWRRYYGQRQIKFCISRRPRWVDRKFKIIWN